MSKRNTWLLTAATVVTVTAVLTIAGSPISTRAEPEWPDERELVRAYLEAAKYEMAGERTSTRYEESITALRERAAQAVEEVSGLLLEGKGSFDKWQTVRLVGDFGDESAVRLLTRFVSQPLPSPRVTDGASERTDPEYSEEFMSRLQAVTSLARISLHRPELKDRVISDLIGIAESIPEMKPTALRRLRELLGPDFQSLRAHFGPEDAKFFDSYLPPPEWQEVLSRRMLRAEAEGLRRLP
ncbi:MAG: hypothetical protein WAU39_10010 [Polyangiales bacterium]